ncbi:MAG: hypothetical protein K5984_07170 [Bacteroidales bacterium]|nr:hypothetical protein [Bacteroidales bacterium]
MRNSLKALLLGMLLVLSCSNPSSRETFVKASDTEVPGKYVFTVDMSDSLTLYDLDLYTIADVRKGDKDSWSDIQAYTRWISPSQQVFSETFTLPDSAFVRKSFNSYHYKRAYRYGVAPKEAGIWTIEINIPVSRQSSCIRGLGLVVTKK